MEWRVPNRKDGSEEKKGDPVVVHCVRPLLPLRVRIGIRPVHGITPRIVAGELGGVSPVAALVRLILEAVDKMV